MDNQAQAVVFDFSPLFTLYQDGSVRRDDLHPPPPPSPQDGVSFKDLTLHPPLGLWARIYLPSPPPPSPSSKLPLVLYFHGGGFIMRSPAHCHPLCIDLCKRSSAIFVSASYRLAPEHRLPAAFDDGFFSLQWLHSQALLQAEGKEELMDPWLARADFSQVFVAGASAGGNLAHRVTIQALNEPWSADAWAPLCIRGLIPIHPGFSRQVRTKEEEEMQPDGAMSWHNTDLCAELRLPKGTTRDHPFANPLPEFAAGEVKHVPPKALVALAERDILRCMGLEYAQALEKAGCSVQVVMSHGVGHGFCILQPNSEETDALYQRIANFIRGMGERC